MMYRWILLLFLLTITHTGAFALEFRGEPVTIELKDPINFPIFQWPKTLLSYPVALASGLDRAKLELVDAQGVRQPIQWGRDGNLNFLSDLPSGAKRVFTLRTGDGSAKASEYRLEVRTPESRSFTTAGWNVFATTVKDGRYPGPIAGIRGRDGKWIGASTLLSPKIPVDSVTVSVPESGELFETRQIVYRFANGSTYTVTLRTINGYDFFEFSEEIRGVTPEDNVRMVIDWTGFSPDYRFGTESYVWNEKAGEWPRLSEKITTASVQEDPHWAPTMIENPAEEMWIKLSPYSGNAIRELFPCVSFWQPNGYELGLFVLNYKKWRDPGYGIWQPTQDLMVRFRWNKQLLSWIFPITEGGRALAVNYAPAETGERFVEDLRGRYLKHVPKATDQLRFNPSKSQIRYNQLLGQIYGPQSLNVVKDWLLDYPRDARRPAAPVSAKHPFKNAGEFEKFVMGYSFVFYPLGQNSWPGVNSINHRQVYYFIMEGYLRYYAQLPEASRRRVEALLLYTAYLLTDDAMHPIRSCLAGCPNMAADGWTVPAQLSVLFPEHPMSAEWRDYFQKYWQVSSMFFTRPEVREWSAKGGRWTESLGIYNWAHFAPTLAAQVAGYVTDGVNRWAVRETAQRGDWMVNVLSSPIVNPDPFWRQNFRKGPPTAPDSANRQPERQIPSIGAHGSGTFLEVPMMYRYLGYFLRNYAPLTAEHLMWADSTTNWLESDRNTNWGRLHIADKVKGNRGTPPELTSSKYTGYGINLRAGVGTPEEVFLYLSQVDDGPNYRWGNSGWGSTGSLFFTAGGKMWTGHEREDTGDHTANDVDGVTGFGAMKQHAFRAIGHNVLDQPLFDLGVAQLATITSRQGPDAYAYPEYEARSVMLVGTDYFLLQDIVRNNGRFSWFIAPDGEYPEMFFLSPQSIRQDHWREIKTPSARGIQRDFGSWTNSGALTLVTHRKGRVKMPSMRPLPLKYSETGFADFRKTGKEPDGIFPVETPESKDLFLRSVRPVRYENRGDLLSGTAGLIRRRNDQSIELALFKTGEVRSGNLGLQINSDTLAASMIRDRDHARLSGIIVNADKKPQPLTLSGNGLDGTFYLDGQAADPAAIPPGRHHWELTARKPTPGRPEIRRTENVSGGASLFFAPVGGAEQYRVELSSDNGATWRIAATGTASPLSVAKLENGTKVHLRLTAVNAERESRPSPWYPLYVTDQPPPHPDGLMLSPGRDTVKATWGECLGVNSYRLYRRERGGEWRPVYEGLKREFTDHAPGAVPPVALPGSGDNARYEGKVYEYAVAAVNRNGEGKLSEIRNTDPTSWLNWAPPVPLKFRRSSEYTKPPYEKPGVTPPLHYPE